MARKPNPTPPTLEVETIKAGEGEEEIQIAEEGGADLDKTTPVEPVVTETVESLRSQLTATEQRAEREAARAAEAERRLNTAATQQVDSNIQIITTAIGSAQAEKQNIMARLRAAKEAGDYDAEIKATDELQTTNVKLQRLEEGKSELERRVEERREFEENVGNSPLERYIAGSQLNGRAAAWVRQNPDVLLSNGNIDQQKLANLNFAHAKAVRDGHAPGSDGYYEAVEEELLGDPDAAPVTPPARQPARPPAAPPGRRPDPVLTNQSASSLPSGITITADGKYRMSPDRVEAARMSGLSNEEYLKHALAIHREGAIN